MIAEDHGKDAVGFDRRVRRPRRSSGDRACLDRPPGAILRYRTSSAPGGPTIHVAQASYSGGSAPGSVVTLLAGKPGPGPLKVVGQGVADGNGVWTATTAPLANGNYRVIAEAYLGPAYPATCRRSRRTP